MGSRKSKCATKLVVTNVLVYYTRDCDMLSISRDIYRTIVQNVRVQEPKNIKLIYLDNGHNIGLVYDVKALLQSQIEVIMWGTSEAHVVSRCKSVVLRHNISNVILARTEKKDTTLKALEDVSEGLNVGVHTYVHNKLSKRGSQYAIEKVLGTV